MVSILLITILFQSSNLILSANLSYSNNIQSVGNDVLQPEDLYPALQFLNRIVDFGVDNVEEENLGYYLINIHLKWIIMRKGNILPDLYNKYLIKIILKNTKPLLKWGNWGAFLTSEENFLMRLKPFSHDNNIAVTPRKLKDKKYTKNKYFYQKYRDMIMDYDKRIPTPVESDICLWSLANNSINMNKQLYKCSIKDTCIDILRNGSDTGYAISHRLLWILLAHFSRGCFLISEVEDQIMVAQFCMSMYREAEYIAEHDFELSDLMQEQMAFCGMVGRNEFFRRSWVLKILSFQTERGCVRINIRTNETAYTRTYVLEKYNECCMHSTYTAAGAIAAAVRHIIEMYF